MSPKPNPVDETDFMPEIEAALRRRGHGFTYVLSLSVCAFCIGGLIWSNYAILDEVTRGTGQVIPSGHTQVIQNLEGGILSDIPVTENSIVDAGTVLVHIDNIQAQSNYQDARSQFLSGTAALARLEGELNDTEPAFPPEVRSAAPEVVTDQMALYRARINRLAADRAVLHSQAAQRRSEIEEMGSKLNQQTANLELARRQRDIAKPLAARNIYPQVEYLKLERDVVQIEGDINTLKLAIPRAQNALAEAESKEASRIAEFRSDVATEINKRRNEVQSLLSASTANKDKVFRTEVRSPVHGTVKQIYTHTIGGVIKPGDNIMEIVPLDDTLLIEAHIRPADIAFLRPGQRAVIKITAYDYSIYGGLRATLDYISADTIKDDKSEKGESFYRVVLRSDENALKHNGRELPIIPGMTATVEILTGKKSVLQYLLKPIQKALSAVIVGVLHRPICRVGRVARCERLISRRRWRDWAI